MNHDELASDPHERLVEVLLAEAVCVGQARSAPPRAASARWLAAALVLLGLGVVVGVAVLRDGDGDADVAKPAQEPESVQVNRHEEFLSLAGPGFRDFTRIAASDPAIWRDILIANREEILKQSERFRGALGVLEQVLRDCQGEALEALVNGVSQTRSHWRMGAGRPVKK